jgi:hypothetical protein
VHRTRHAVAGVGRSAAVGTRRDGEQRGEGSRGRKAAGIQKQIGPEAALRQAVLLRMKGREIFGRKDHLSLQRERKRKLSIKRWKLPLML